MKPIKVFLKLFLFTFFVFFLCQCEKEALEPFTLFETETLGSDTTALDLKGLDSIPKIVVNGDKVMETDSGYHINGTLFAESLFGMVPITSGDIDVVHDEQGNTTSFSGYGSVIYPKAGFFEHIESEMVSGGYFEFLQGKEFKKLRGKPDLPLLDERYYFGFNLDDNENGESPSLKIKNIKISYHDYFIDPNDPAIIVDGLLGFDATVLGRTINEANLAIGLSASGLFPFTPHIFSDEMEVVTEGMDFEEFSGQVLLKGDFQLGFDNLSLNGEAVIGNASSENSILDFFENGFNGEYMMGANGELSINKGFHDCLPSDLEINLAKATLQTKVSKDDSYLKIAGEYKQENLLAEILGSEIMEYIYGSGSEGKIYFSFGNDIDDWYYYIETELKLEFPQIGTKKIIDGVIKASPSGYYISGSVEFPYDIGLVSFSGELYRNGNFLLEGQAEYNPDFGDGFNFNSSIHISCSNDSLSFSGSADFPYDIGEVDVTGNITQECISLDGHVTGSLQMAYSNIPEVDLQLHASSCDSLSLKGSVVLPYSLGEIDVEGGISSTEGLRISGKYEKGAILSPSGFSLPLPVIDLQVSASSQRGISMYGSLDIPHIGETAVSGKIASDELLLTGMLNNNQYFDFTGMEMPTVDMQVELSTKTGIELYGKIDVPYNILLVDVTGSLTSEGLRLGGTFNSNIDFGNGISFPAVNMALSASTVPSEGVTFSGNLNIPNIGYVSGTGNMNSSNIEFTGAVTGGLDIAGVPLLSHSLLVSIREQYLFGTWIGVKALMYGNINFPCGFGNIYCSGIIDTNGTFELHGSQTFGVDLIVASGSTTVTADVLNSGVGFSSSTTLCAGVDPLRVCNTSSAAVEVDWVNLNFKICATLIGIDLPCIDSQYLIPL